MFLNCDDHYTLLCLTRFNAVDTLLYDASGEVIEEEVDMFGKSDESQAWEDYWRTLYPKVTVNKLKEFEKKYKQSDEERDDLKKAYSVNSEKPQHFIFHSFISFGRQALLCTSTPRATWTR